MFEIVIYILAAIGFLTIILAIIGRKGIAGAFREARLVYKANKNWGKKNGS